MNQGNKNALIETFQFPNGFSLAYNVYLYTIAFVNIFQFPNGFSQSPAPTDHCL